MKTFKVRKTHNIYTGAVYEMIKRMNSRYIRYYKKGVIGNEQALFSRLCREVKKSKAVK